MPIVLFCVVLGIDFGLIPTNEAVPSVQSRIREILLGIGLIMFIWITSRLTWFRERTLISRLRFLAVFLILLWIGLKVAGTGRYSRVLFRDDVHAFDTLPFSGPMNVFAFVIVVILSVWIFITLKELIFIQQSKKTERNFRYLQFFMYLIMFSSLMRGAIPLQGTIQFGRFYRASTVEFVVIGFFILFTLINGFRCKWIHYLNKQQKVLVFFFGALTFSFVLIRFIGGPIEVGRTSVVVGSFVYSVLSFCVVYMAMSLIGILFHLPSAGLMDRRINELRSLQTLSSTIGSVLNEKELISKATELSKKVVNADYTWIELSNGDRLKLAGTHGVRKEDVEKIPRAIQEYIRQSVNIHDGALLVNDLLKDRQTRGIKAWKQRVGSLLAAMICFKDRNLGILYAVRTDKFGFPEESRGLFQAFADQVAVALENVNLVQVTIEQQVYHEELRLAHDAQMRLLPQQMPKILGLEIDAFCMTANEIGGDFYDIIEVDENRVDVVVGDVSGKGASAAFYMAELKGVLQALAPHFESPKKMLVEVNTFLRNHFESNTFATMTYGMYLPSKRQMKLVRAGHPPAGLIRNNAVSWLETEGLGLGMAKNEFFVRHLKEKSLTLRKGDMMLFYTDGLIEARNSEGAEYGESALEEILIQLQEMETQALVADIRRCLESFTENVPRHDDVTCVAIRISK